MCCIAWAVLHFKQDLPGGQNRSTDVASSTTDQGHEHRHFPTQLKPHLVLQQWQQPWQKLQSAVQRHLVLLRDHHQPLDCGAAAEAPKTAPGPPKDKPANGLGQLAVAPSREAVVPGEANAAALLAPKAGVKLAVPKAGAELRLPKCGHRTGLWEGGRVATGFPKAGAVLPAAPDDAVKAAVAGTAVEP